MSDYTFKFWTDEMNLQLVKESYPSLLETYIGYEYPIQRADSIRYMILHKFGGVYLDLDIGCLKRYLHVH